MAEEEFSFANALKQKPAESVEEVGEMSFANALRSSPTPSPMTMAEEMQTAVPASADVQRGAFQGLRDMWSGKARMTPEIEGLPHVFAVQRYKSLDEIPQDYPDKANQALMAFNTSSSVEEFAKGYKDIFPEVSIEKDAKDNLIAVFPDGQRAVFNKPGVDRQDVMRFGTELLKYVPAQRFAAGGKTILGKAGRAGLGSFATSTINEMLSPEFDQSQVVMETALGPAGEVGGALIKGFPKAVYEAPTAAKVAFTTLKKQEPELIQSITDYIQKNTADVDEMAAEQFRETAQKAISAPIEAMKETAAPLYEAAAAQARPVNLNKTRQLANKYLKTAPQKDGKPQGQVAAKVQEALDLVSPVREKTGILRESGQEIVNVSEQNFINLDNAKKLMDDAINMAQRKDSGIGNQTKGALTAIRNSLRDALDTATRTDPSDPASSLYKQARDVYSEELPKVKELRSSILGKVEQLEDRDLESIRTQLFKKNRRLSQIRQTREVMERTMPGSMDNMVAAEMLARMETIKYDDTIPKVTSRLFGNPAADRRLLEAASPQQRIVLEKFRDILQQASYKSSLAKREVLGEGLKSLMAVVKIPQRMGDRQLAKMANDKVLAFIEATNNPEILKRPEMKRFSKLATNTFDGAAEGIRILTQLTDEIMQSIPEEQEQTQETE